MKPRTIQKLPTKKQMKKMNNISAYIKEGVSRTREHRIHGSIPVVIKDGVISDEVDMEEFVENIESLIPTHLMRDIEIVYVGDFPALEDRNAIYADGAIYISNKERTTHDMLENVIHEIAHSIESRYGAVIYKDSQLRSEFMGKRERLKAILDSHGYKLPDEYYLNSEYTEEFDAFLSQEVGYPALVSLTMGLFASPYGATSLREYFANGFEKFYLGEPRRVKETSPVLYNILKELFRESDI
jgi:hypothetical protein